MTIKTPYFTEDRINVVVNGVCNHYGVEEAVYNFGQGDQDDKRLTQVCSCGMIQDADGCWVEA